MVIGPGTTGPTRCSERRDRTGARAVPTSLSFPTALGDAGKTGLGHSWKELLC